MELHIHVHHHEHNNSINLKLDKIMGALEDIKAKLALSNEKITILTTATQGVKQDVAFIKAKLEANEGGLDAAGVAEVMALIDDQDSKLNEAATELQALDDETDSSESES